MFANKKEKINIYYPLQKIFFVKSDIFFKSWLTAWLGSPTVVVFGFMLMDCKSSSRTSEVISFF